MARATRKSVAQKTTKTAAKPTAAKQTATRATTKVAKPTSGEKTVQIPDPGLFLAVLEALIEEDILDEDRLDPLLADIETSDEDLDPDDEEARVAAAIAILHALPLEADAVARIECVDFDGGNDIYMLLEEVLEIETGGEADYYQLRSLQGIEALRSLVALNLDGHGFNEAKLDLSPLAGHPTLAILRLSGKCTGARALESLPALKELTARRDKLDEPAVLDRLAARGVAIRED